jgi:hypothetical protein
LPFVLGGVLACLPTLAVLVADSEAFMFNLLSARLEIRDSVVMGVRNGYIESDPNLAGLEFLLSFLKLRLNVIYSFFFWATLSPKSTIQNILLLGIIALIAANGLKRSKKDRQAWRNAVMKDNFISFLFWIGLAIFLSHFFTIMQAYYYIQFLFPITTLVLLGILFHGGINTFSPSFIEKDGWVLRVLTILLVPYMFYHLAFSSINLIRRNSPSVSRPTTIAHVGCWIEKNSKAEEEILGIVGGPIVMAGRKLPKGYEYPSGIEHMFWMFNLDEKTSQRFKIFRRQDFERSIRSGRFRILVMEYQFASWVERLGLEEDRDKNYHLFATTGGSQKDRRYDIYLRNDQKDTDFTKMPTINGTYPLEQLVQLLKGKNRLNGNEYTLQSAFAEILSSAGRLPTDIRLAWARFRQAPYESRCSAYLETKSSQPGNQIKTPFS